jgi:hypothetical protein
MDDDADAFVFETEAGYLAINSSELESIVERDDEYEITSVASAFMVVNVPGLMLLSISSQSSSGRLVPGESLPFVDSEEFAESTEADVESFDLWWIPRDRFPASWQHHVRGESAY